MKKTYLFITTLLFFFFASSQNFEGEIKLVKKTLSDTTYLTYSIKGNQIRIDEHDKYKRLQRYFLVNINDKSIFVINPSKKLYVNMPAKENNLNAENLDFDIVKTNNYRDFNGFKCYQWRVRNVKQNTEIAYWVAEENFTFFSELVKTFDNSERNLAFYLMIPDSEGRMPMLAVERTLLRDEKIRLAVTSVNEGKLEDSLFLIPETYKNLQTRR